jgi:protein SCO1
MIEPTRAIRIVAGLILMMLLLTSCRSSTPDQALHGGHTGHGEETGAAAPAAAGDFSIYELESTWSDQDGAELALADLAGRPRVIAMVYTHCAYACPRIVTDMKRIEAELRERGVQAGFVVVSIDPERDTPARLAAFAEATRLDPREWTLLTGSDDGVMELAALLGVRYRRVSDMDFEHSNVITLVDDEGRILYRQTGLGADPASLVAAAQR